MGIRCSNFTSKESTDRDLVMKGSICKGLVKAHQSELMRLCMLIPDHSVCRALIPGHVARNTFLIIDISGILKRRWPCLIYSAA